LNKALFHLNKTLQFNKESDFIFALYNVVHEQGGLNELAEKTGLGRESLYKSLDSLNNPRFSTIVSVIRALGFELKIELQTKSQSLEERKPCINRLNSLSDTHPTLAKQWNTKRNMLLTPNDVTSGSRKYVWWTCSKNQDHEWQASAYSRRSGTECPFCSGKKVSEDNNLKKLYPSVAAEWHPLRNGSLTPNDINPASNKKFWWSCGVNGHEWVATCSNRTVKKSKCPVCIRNGESHR
jgi:probable addiction module antidote protein